MIITFNLAGASYFGGLYEQARRAYRTVLDSTPDPELRRRAALGLDRSGRALEAASDATSGPR